MAVDLFEPTLTGARHKDRGCVLFPACLKFAPSLILVQMLHCSQMSIPSQTGILGTMVYFFLSIPSHTWDLLQMCALLVSEIQSIPRGERCSERATERSQRPRAHSSIPLAIRLSSDHRLDLRLAVGK